MPRKDPRLNNPADSVNEKIQDATIRHMLFMEGLKTRETRKVLEFIDDDILPDLRDQLNARLSRGLTEGATTARIEQIITQLQSITDRFKDINTRIQGDLFETALYERDFNIEMLKDNIPIQIDYTLPAPEQIRQVLFSKPFDGRTLEQWFNRLADSTQQRLSSEIRRGFVEGQTGQQVVKRITDAGILKTTRKQTEAVVRSAFQHAATSARNQVFLDNSDVIKNVKWVATLDSRTCPTCMALDGEVYPLDSGKRPPIHVNCRCGVTAVTKSFRDLGVDVDEVDAGTRASMNGQVPKDLTYNQWLKKQPVDIQNEALGKKRAQLFRKGDLNVEQFVSRNGHEYTLNELRQREMQAFVKADIDN